MLADLAPGPVVTLNHAVAVAMVARAGRPAWRLLDPLLDDDRLRRHHRLHAVRAHLLDLAGDRRRRGSRTPAAARLATSLPEQRYLSGRATAG